jgi:hypothetical protein
MPLGKGIVAMVSAVQERVEVSGQAPTWRVTAGTFDGAVAYAREAWEEPVVLAATPHGRWWPRVTVTVTVDPALAASAPPLEELRVPDRVVPRQRGSAGLPVPDQDAGFFEEDLVFEPGMVSLEQIFTRQEAVRLRNGGVIPRQRSGSEVAGRAG